MVPRRSKYILLLTKDECKAQAQKSGYHGHLEIVKYLAGECGADIEANCYGNTAVRIAASNSHR